MPSTSPTATTFPARIRARGEGYFRAGCVRVVQWDGCDVYAEVQGSELYSVGFRVEDGRVQGSWCECPYFADHGPCKHIWATILAVAEAAGPEAPGVLARVRPGPAHAPGDGARAGGARAPDWRTDLEHVRAALERHGRGRLVPRAARVTRERRILYVLDLDEALLTGALLVRIRAQERRRDGSWGRIKRLRMGREDIAGIGGATDRDAMGALFGAETAADEPGGLPRGYAYHYGHHWHPQDRRSAFRLEAANSRRVLETLCATGRCHTMRASELGSQPLAWEDGPPWVFGLRIEADRRRNTCAVTGFLRRGPEETVDLSRPAVLHANGILVLDGSAGPFDPRGAFPWVALLRQRSPVTAALQDRDEVVRAILDLPANPLLELPAPWSFREKARAPRPILRAHVPDEDRAQYHKVEGQLLFDYDGAMVEAGDPRESVGLPAERRVLPRDVAAEREARARLLSLGFKAPSGPREEHGIEISPRHFPRAAHALLADGWSIVANGVPYRSPGPPRFSVTTGIDWFEVRGEADFDGQTVPIPAVLEALRQGRREIRLGDGSTGVLPEEWLETLGLLVQSGETRKDHIRFGRAQGLLLDALLASQPSAGVDRPFSRFREKVRAFRGIRPQRQPAGFHGKLRPYQQVALGWFAFLREFGLGGCLADDMGLGKTIQVLALLEQLRRKQATGPSLIVAPRSVVFNWIQEATRFTPRLRVVDYTGPGRKARFAEIERAHIAVTSYGVLRRDIFQLKDVPFTYVVLDEAQAIKNASSQSAKAARLLQPSHRLALTGTPVENHLGELWSIVEFLNPGLLGKSSAFRAWTGGTRDLSPAPGRGGHTGLRHTPGRTVTSDESRTLLARAIRPILLRRTKEEVAPELPERVEQTLTCELGPTQRRLYSELRNHYRATLLEKVGRDGLARCKIQVLEALLRLRQCACHPGLIDPGRKAQESAKLDVLLSHLEEISEEGHKALVFSQFTRFLAIVRERVDRAGLTYEYLDGRTRDRQRKVERFRTDPACRLFLISLKAGGLGLNLTEAGYVFLLDPWWNPAVEAQAIDRSHRIGQRRRVVAYRLIARGTVEERIVELQRRKKDLADAILAADGGLLKKLTREDLETLLG